VKVLTHLICDWLVCDEEIDEDGDEGEGDEEPPAELPVDAGRDVHHELDVSALSRAALTPGG
jgi:hypothetical protein